MSLNIEQALAFMRQHGSSVVLNWGEDNDLWECSWITSGKRYTGFSRDPLEAITQAYYHARSGTPAPKDSFSEWKRDNGW